MVANDKKAHEATIEANTARECVEHIVSGALTSEEVVQHHLALIEQSDAQIKAWQNLDKDRALMTAKMLDDVRRRGEPLGSLHGVPIGIKDIYDTSDYPTENGSVIHADRQPDADCRVVLLLPREYVVDGRRGCVEVDHDPCLPAVIGMLVLSLNRGAVFAINCYIRCWRCCSPCVV